MNSDSRTIQPIPKNEEDIPPANLVFYCKKCEELVEAKQTKKKFHFRCPKCGKEEVAFGTEESIRNHYHIKNWVAYFHFKIEDDDSMRLDKFLARELPQFSRSFLAKCELLVNSKRAKPSQKIENGDFVEIKVPALKTLKIQPIG